MSHWGLNLENMVGEEATRTPILEFYKCDKMTTLVCLLALYWWMSTFFSNKSACFFFKSSLDQSNLLALYSLFIVFPFYRMHPKKQSPWLCWMTDQPWPLTAPIGLKKPTLRRLPELRCIVVNPRLRLLSIVSKRSMKIDIPESCDIRYGFHGFAHSQISIS